jgi:hypothetical protein
MTHDGMCRRNNDYGESPVPRRNVPIASSLLASRACQRSQLKTARISNTRHSLEAPLRVEVGSWPPQPSACPATQPPLCRVSLMRAFFSCEPRERASSPKGKSFSPRRSREETPSAPRQRLLSRSIGRGQPARQARPDGSADSWVAGSASLRLRLTHAGRAPG